MTFNNSVVAGVKRRIGQIAGAVLFVDGALLDEALDDAGRDTGHRGEFTECEDASRELLEHRDHLLPRRGHPVGVAVAQPVDPPQVLRSR